MASSSHASQPKTATALFTKKREDPDEAKKRFLNSGAYPSGGEHLRFLPDPAPGHFDGSPGSHRQHHRNFDINLYATKKSAAQGLLDLALLMANASQLKHIILTDGDHRFYVAMIALLSASIALQIIVAIGLLFLVRIRLYDYSAMQPSVEDGLGTDQTDEAAKRQEMAAEEERVQKKLRRADFLNNITVGGIFILTVINVFISAFGLNESPRRELARDPKGKEA